jgi:nucleoid DNA-binding protein
MTSSGDTAELLRLYFIQQRSINLPGIGGFELSRIPARVDSASGTIKAPYYAIRYDSFSDIPSKEMFAFISRKRNISEWEAIVVVNNFSMAVSDQLKRGQRFDWEGIGSLEHNVTGQLEFQPVASQFDFLPDLPVGIQTGSHTDIVSEQFEEESGTVEAKASWWVTAAVIAAVSLAMIFFSFIRNEYKLTGSRESRFIPAVAPNQNETKLAD